MLLMTVEGAPGQKLIDLSDEVLESFFKYSGISQYRKLCFAVHELVINVVEATLEQQAFVSSFQQGAAAEDSKIAIRMELTDEDIVITISNDGPYRTTSEKRKLNLEDLKQEDRRRGLLIAKRLSDQLILEQDEQGRITIQLRKKGGAEHGRNSLWTSV